MQVVDNTFQVSARTDEKKYGNIVCKHDDGAEDGQVVSLLILWHHSDGPVRARAERPDAGLSVWPSVPQRRGRPDTKTLSLCSIHLFFSGCKTCICCCCSPPLAKTHVRAQPTLQTAKSSPLLLRSLHAYNECPLHYKVESIVSRVFFPFLQDQTVSALEGKRNGCFIGRKSSLAAIKRDVDSEGFRGD